MPRIIIAGGRGLIGRALTRELRQDNHEVLILSRNPGQATRVDDGVKIFAWDGTTQQGWGKLVEGADAVVNLAGANLAGENLFPARFTKERKQIIMQSRLNAAKAIIEAIDAAREKPKLLIQSSAIGYYGPLGDQPVDESGEAGKDFMAQVLQEVEQSTEVVETLGVRRVVTRSGVVLTDQGGALTRLLIPFKLFAGGPFGNGRQVMSWIHIIDEVKAIRFLIENPGVSGVYNLTAPNAVTNAEMGKVIAKILRRPYYLPVPGFALRLLFGEVATVVLDGQRVLPTRLLASGYEFKYPRIDMALAEIL
jgi:uncharacterized protein (TIGR01777 family)